MKDIVISQTNIYRSNVTGLAVLTHPKIETLNSWQVLQIAHAIKKAVDGLHLEIQEK